MSTDIKNILVLKSRFCNFPSWQKWPFYTNMIICSVRIWMWYANGVDLSAIWENTTLILWVGYEPLGDHFIHGTCAVFSHITQKMNNVCIFSHDEVIYDITAVHFQFKLQLECDMGWYRYTSHSENHCTECMKWKILFLKVTYLYLFAIFIPLDMRPGVWQHALQNNVVLLPHH